MTPFVAVSWMSRPYTLLDPKASRRCAAQDRRRFAATLIHTTCAYRRSPGAKRSDTSRRTRDDRKRKPECRGTRHDVAEKGTSACCRFAAVFAAVGFHRASVCIHSRFADMAQRLGSGIELPGEPPITLFARKQVRACIFASVFHDSKT